MNIPNPLEMFRYRYVPTDVVLEINGEEYEFKEGAVMYVHFIHQFVSRHLPVIKVGLQTEIKIIRLIYDDIDKAKFTFTIREEKLDEDEVVLDTEEYLKHTFSIVPAYEKPVYITSDEIYDQSKAKPQNEDKSGEVETLRSFQLFEFYLVDMEAVNWFDMEYSDHLKDVSYEGSLQKLFMARDIPPDKGFCTPPLLTGKLENVTIPIGDLVENINFLNQTYGLYQAAPIVYYDMEYMYCLDKVKPNIIWPSKTEFGTVTFILLNPENEQHHITGSNDDVENETHWVNLQSDPNIFESKFRDTSAKMSTLTSVKSSGEINTTTLDEEATRLRYIYALNDLTEQQVLNETMTGETIAITMQNIKASFLRPFKDYTFEVDTSYESLHLTGKIYRMLNFNMDIQRIGSKGYVTTESIMLYNPVRE